MSSRTSRRDFFQLGAMAMATLGVTSFGNAEPSTSGYPRSEPHSTRPGDPVFLLEGSTVEDFWGVRRRVNPLIRSSRNPIIVKDRNWEGSGPYTYGSALYDPQDKLFKCWYTVYHDNEYRKRLPGSYMVCYATSKDGYLWQKPELDLVEWKASRRNNFIRLGQKYVSAITVILTPPDSGIRSRYVAAYLDAPGICLAYSDNGTEWTEHKLNPIDSRHSDTHNSIVYDPARRKWMVHHRPGLFVGPSKRRVAVIESQDLQTWTRPEVVLIPDEADVPEFYGMPVFQRGNLFFGLLQIYDRPAGRIEVELVFSPDGLRWERVPPRELFLTRGSPGEFDGGMVFTASGPVIAHDEMRFYYGGWSIDHNQPTPNDDVALASIGMASVPLDRLFGVTTTNQDLGLGATTGLILTRPLLLGGSTLEVNASIQGQLKVALLDIDGKELPGFELDNCRPIKGDDLRHRVSWGDKSLPTRGLKRLKFQLERATFYAFYMR